MTAPQPAASGAWRSLAWLFLAIFCAVTPAVAFEQVVSRDATFWEWARNREPSASPANQALRFEAFVHAMAEGGGRDVIVLGNSVVAENIDHAQLRECCAPQTQVARLTLVRLSVLEIAMLAERLKRSEPQVVVMAFTRWDLMNESWDGVRFYNLDVARGVSVGSSMLQKRDVHLRGLLNGRLALFRHRQALLEVAASALSIPLAEMYQVSPLDPWTEKDISARDLDGLHGRSLRVLARQLGAAGIRLVVFSPPSRATALGQSEVVAEQRRVESEIAVIAAEEGFGFVSSPSFGEFEADLFRDAIHLKPHGTARFTKRISPFIQEALTVPDDQWPPDWSERAVR